MTRAKRELTLSYARRRRRYGDYEPCEPSSFLHEIAPAHVERVGPGPSVVTWHKGKRPAASPRETPRGTRTRPAEPGPVETTSKLAAGDMVRHPLWGVGTVQSLSGKGEKLKAVVRFDTVGAKTLMVAYAKLDRLAGEE